jgi:hypothetical protein
MDANKVEARDPVAMEAAEFHRPTLEAARELGLSNEELQHRLELTRQIVANLAIIREESVGLNVIGERVASLATALKLGARTGRGALRREG